LSKKERIENRDAGGVQGIAEMRAGRGRGRAEIPPDGIRIKSIPACRLNTLQAGI
jgi:hypothetical protein